MTLQGEARAAVSRADDGSIPHQGVAAPVIKYAGGKRWAIPILGPGIAAHLAGAGRRFIDPFVGGGALPLWLGGLMLLGDLDRDVAELYQVMKERPGELVWNLSALAIRGVDAESYYRVRDLRPKTAVGRAARFVYLNRLGFNGLNRRNAKGESNVPYANDQHRRSILERSARDAVEALFPNKEKFIKAGRALAQADIVHADFSELVVQAMARDVVFADSPYDDSFDKYTPGGFTVNDHARLARVLRAAADRGALFFAHNKATPRIKDLYKGFHFFPVKEKRQINSDVKGRARVPCVIITNAPELLDRQALRKEGAS